jgi:cation transport regulator ChaB
MNKIIQLSQKYLPPWLYKELHYAARAYAGGKLRGRKRKETIQKPYDSLQELPDAVKNLPKKKRRQWMHVFNSVYERVGEQRAHAAAWAAVNKESVVGNFRIIKADDEKRLLYGVVYAPLEVDTQKDFAEAEEIEKAAHQFLILYGRGEAFIDEGHNDKRAEAEPVESFIAPVEFTYDNASEPCPKGSWVLVTHFLTDRAWKRAKEEYAGYSMAGKGKRERVT